jgi:hypothetical protein
MYPRFLCYFPFDQEDSLTLITLPDSAGFLFLISIIIKIPLQGDYRPVTIKYQYETCHTTPFAPPELYKKPAIPSRESLAFITDRRIMKEQAGPALLQRYVLA